MDESNNPGHIVGLLNLSVCVPWLKHMLYMVKLLFCPQGFCQWHILLLELSVILQWTVLNIIGKEDI